jgi:hypothetical protein
MFDTQILSYNVNVICWNATKYGTEILFKPRLVLNIN